MEITMGTYLSKVDDSIRVTESQKMDEKNCSQDMIINSKSIKKQNVLSVIKSYDINGNYTSDGEKVTANFDRQSNKSFNMSPTVQIELLKYPRTRFNNSSDGFSKVIDVSKLLAQLLNAKVVLEKLEEPLLNKFTRRFPLTRGVIVRDNIDLGGEKDVARNTSDYTHRYCDKCKKTVFACVKDTKSKYCSNCKTPMTHLCTRCNVKHYKRYAFLLYHWDRCNGRETSFSHIDEVDETKSNIEDTINHDVDGNQSNVEDTSITTDANINSTLSLDENQFIVKQLKKESLSKEYTRYCSECDLTITDNLLRDCKCGKRLLFACKKCNAKYKSMKSISSHLKSQCYPANEYRCTHCNYSTTVWIRMRNHFNNVHTEGSWFQCEFCPYKTKYKSNLNSHKKVHCRKIANNGKFHCKSCRYSTNFSRNIQRHQKLCH